MSQRSEDSRINPLAYEGIIDEICGLQWKSLDIEDLTDLAEITCDIYPDDWRIRRLKQEECNTDNLSPWPGVANNGERLNHDEFMRRLLCLTPINDMRRRRIDQIGQIYLIKVRKLDFITRAASIAAYEGGGLERVFRAILESQHWNSLLLQAFRHFLMLHIRFDNDPVQGHGALTRQLMPDDRILPIWIAFKCLLVEAVPKLDGTMCTERVIGRELLGGGG
jgi:hypothetical protein